MSESSENPSSPSLAEVEAAFDRGNYLEARRLSEALSKSDEEETRRGAEEFLSRLQPPPITRYLLLLTGVLLLAVTIFAYTRP